MRFTTLKTQELKTEQIILDGQKFIRRGSLLNAPEWSYVSQNTGSEFIVHSETKEVLENLYQELSKEVKG